MIISFGRKFIFVHTPKTGGSSLSLALEGRAKADDILIGDSPKAVQRRKRVQALQTSGRLWKHSTLADIGGVVDSADLADFFLCTLVRNPWDRAVSYYHWLRLQNWEHDVVTLAKTHSFSEFLNTPSLQKSLFASYSDCMRDCNGRLHSAHYMRLERLDEELQPLWSHLGFDLSPIARVNASQRARDFRQYYSDEDARLVRHLAVKDIARFGYQFSANGL